MIKLNSCFAGLGPAVLKELAMASRQTQARHSGIKHDRLQQHDICSRAEAAFASGNLDQAAALFAQLGDKAKQDLDDVNFVIQADRLCEKVRSNPILSLPFLMRIAAVVTSTNHWKVARYLQTTSKRANRSRDN